MIISVQGSKTLHNIVHEAVSSLVRVREIGHEFLISVPNFYPSGAEAVVSVSAYADGVRVSDLGFAYREAKMVGAELFFARRAKKAAEKIGVHYIDRCFSAFSPYDQLAATITDISSVSTEVSHQAVARLQNEGEGEVASHLLEKLSLVFGPPHVEVASNFRGASSREWDITALVKLEGKSTAFKAVGNHPMSVYYAHAALNDIALLGHPPKTVSVVKNIRAMGNLYSILAQVGDVLEEDAPDQTFKLALAA